jgi:polyisoprenoid-binding protein YceI
MITIKKIHAGVLVLSLIIGLFGMTASSAFAQTSSSSCTYELDKNSVVVGWTGFKTTQKTAVTGTFKKVEVIGKTKAQNVAQLMDGLKVSVDDLSVDSGNPLRDKNLIDFFFKKLKPSISGKIKNFSEKTQSFVLALTFNGQTKDIRMNFAAGQDQNYVATGPMDILAFGGKSALSALNQQCLVLHKGPDGVSKTWPEAMVTLKGTIKKTCQ